MGETVVHIVCSLFIASRTLGFLELAANLQQGYKVYSLNSCQEAELVEFRVDPLGTSVLLVQTQPEFRPSQSAVHPVIRSTSRENKYLCKICLLAAKRQWPFDPVQVCALARALWQ